MEELENAYELGLRGDVEAVDRAFESLLGPEEITRAWRAAFGILRWFAVPSPPSVTDEVAREVSLLVEAGPEARTIAARACAQLVRARALSFDARGLSTSIALANDLARGLVEEEAGAWARIAAGYGALASGATLDRELESAAKLGVRTRRADLLLEASALRAYIEATTLDEDEPPSDRLDAAIALARRVSRMARTEALPQLEYLAHLALARVRRISGKPHLATRILTALLRVATPPWRPWLAWEMIHAHGTCAVEEGPGSHAPQLLLALLDSGRRGDRPSFARALIEARHVTAGFAPHAHDLEQIRVAIDFEADPAALLFPRGLGAPSPHRMQFDGAPHPVRAASLRHCGFAALHSFCTGETDEPPRGQVGLCGPEAAKGEAIAWVFAPTEGAPRRVLAPGLGLVRSQASMLDGSEGEGPQLRTDSTIAALALAGQGGIDENALFKRLYGFSYEPERHQAVRGVLYGRVRQRLGSVATLEREGGRLWLRYDRAILVPDPRSTPPAELRILQVLAEHRRAAPKEVASALGIPLRTAQDALRRLTDDGAVRKEKAARGLHYILEDTTFSEPTKTTHL